MLHEISIQSGLNGPKANDKTCSQATVISQKAIKKNGSLYIRRGVSGSSVERQNTYGRYKPSDILLLSILFLNIVRTLLVGGPFSLLRILSNYQT